MDTGMNGRGVLGRFGPNHAVDNGVLTLKEDNNGDIKLHALGILRKFDGDVPALAGGFAEYSKNYDGGYTFNRNHELDTKTKEFFDEMVSGSIEFMPEYNAVLTDEVNAALDTRIAARIGEDLSKRQKEEIAEQVETGLKLQQVETYDPDFLTRLYEITASGRECFAGPVLKSNRNTNNAWIETRLSWFMMDDTIWSYIKGKNPTFDYDFSPGDDGSGVQVFEISPWLLDNASGSHGALFAFMSASYLLKMQEDGTEIPTTVIDQMKDLASFLVSHKPQHYTNQTNARISP